MPGIYLKLKKFAIKIDDCQYQNRWQVMDKPLYIDKQLTKQIADISQFPVLLPPDCRIAYTIAEEDQFIAFFMKWIQEDLYLYRGFPGCHYCWPELLNGILRSEGQRDYPEFTMGQSGTKWLPTADDVDLAQGVSIQCIDKYTKALSLIDKVPIGFTVRIFANTSTVHLPLCWLNSGEIVVQGPLRVGQYSLHSITCLHKNALSFRPWPATFLPTALPPQRPYEPASQQLIDDWWVLCQGWISAAAQVNAL